MIMLSLIRPGSVPLLSETTRAWLGQLFLWFSKLIKQLILRVVVSMTGANVNWSTQWSTQGCGLPSRSIQRQVTISSLSPLRCQTIGWDIICRCVPHCRRSLQQSLQAKLVTLQEASRVPDSSNTSAGNALPAICSRSILLNPRAATQYRSSGLQIIWGAPTQQWGALQWCTG